MKINFKENISLVCCSLHRYFPTIVFTFSFIAGFVVLILSQVNFVVISPIFLVTLIFLFSCSIYWIIIYKYISNQKHILVPDQYYNLNHSFFWFPILGISIGNLFFAFFSYFGHELQYLELTFTLVYFISTGLFSIYSLRFADIQSKDSFKYSTQFNIYLFLLITITSLIWNTFNIAGIITINFIDHYLFLITSIFSISIILSFRATLPAIGLIKKNNDKNKDFIIEVTQKKLEKELIERISSTIIAQAEKEIIKHKQSAIDSLNELIKRK